MWRWRDQPAAGVAGPPFVLPVAEPRQIELDCFCQFQFDETVDAHPMSQSHRWPSRQKGRTGHCLAQASRGSMGTGRGDHRKTAPSGKANGQVRQLPPRVSVLV
jgi:hypothetical protein